MDEFSLLESFTQVYRRWWLVALLVFAGGFAGWGFHKLLPPLYEASAIIVAHIDFEQTGHLNELEQDQSILAVQALFSSDEVMQKVMGDIKSQDFHVNKLVYGENLFQERKRSELSLIVRDPDPKVAAQVANLWAQRSYEALSEAHQHALRAQAIRTSFYSVSACPTPAPGSRETSACQPPANSNSQKVDPALQTELEKETQASKAIIPAIVFNLSIKAQAPAKPVAYSDEAVILAGALIGFLLGVLLASLPLPVRSLQKDQGGNRGVV